MMKSSAYVDKHNENPVKFEHFSLDFIGTYINGEGNHSNSYNHIFQLQMVNYKWYIKAYNTLTSFN